MALHISISAEPVFHLGELAITNSIITSLIVAILLVGVSLWAKFNVKYTKKPVGLQNFLEMLVEGLYNLTNSITESPKKTTAIFPFVLSFFLFILLNNWLGLLPGVGTVGFNEPSEAEVKTESVSPFIKPVSANESVPALTNAETKTENPTPSQIAENKVETPNVDHESTKFVPYLRAGTADLNTTLALALISVLATQYFGVKYLGLSYFKKFFNFKGPIDVFVGILELVSEISKIVSFAFRLFGNVFAGEVLLAVMAFLVPIIVPVPFLGLEIFVGAIQAFVFATLSLVFMNLATIGHTDEHHEAHA